MCIIPSNYELLRIYELRISYLVFSCCSSFLLIPSKMEVTIERMKLNKSAHQKPSTWNPSTIRDAIIMIKAFIARRNKPNEKIVTGIVKITMMGFTTAFKNDNTAATIKAVRKLLLSMLTCGSKYEAISTANVEIISCKMNFIE